MTTTKTSKNNKLYDIRMKFQRAGVTDFEGLNEALADYEPTAYEQEIIGDIYDHIAENIEREQIASRTREEWAELERQYVAKSIFPLSELVGWLLDRYEGGEITRAELKEIRWTFKPCKHRFCLNYFKPRRKNQVYCSEDCRKLEDAALKDFERTGTYLPPTAYSSPRKVEKEKGYREHERIFDPHILTEVLTEIEDAGGKRNRANEERAKRAEDIEKETNEYSEKLLQSVGETPLNVGNGTSSR
ncbi:hypothetical protein [Siminovitchia fortis]|uniref:hypothetical protein n=1 Tax=Siminovitchia fortis TaxID=254758 RepID=UPI00119FB987|nr:hypothetical protein [Siminovitchia fortis]